MATDLASDLAGRLDAIAERDTLAATVTLTVTTVAERAELFAAGWRLLRMGPGSWTLRPPGKAV